MLYNNITKELFLLKKFLSSLLMFSVLFCSEVYAADVTCTQVDYPIYVDGVLLPVDNLPVLNLNGSTYVPLRKVSEGANLYVNWDAESRTISIANVDASFKQCAGFGVNLMWKFREAEYLISDCYVDIVDAIEYADGIDNAQQIKWINDSFEDFDQKIESIGSSITNLKNILPSYETFTEMLKCNPDEILLTLTNARRNFEIIKNAAVGYLNGNFTEKYYRDTLAAYRDAARNTFWETHGSAIRTGYNNCLMMLN